MSILRDHLGSWRGTNAFRLAPDDAPHEASARATVATAARGLVTEVTLTWEHPEAGEQTGLLVVAAGEGDGTVLAQWSDTFHAAPTALRLDGTSEQGLTRLACTYAGDWVWAVLLDATDPGRLEIRMDNTVPESGAEHGFTPGTYWAMRAELGRDDAV